MEIATFAARRAARLTETDDELRPIVEDALAQAVAGEADWQDELLDAVSLVWFENHQAEAPGAGTGGARLRFRENASEALDQTVIGEDVDQAQVDRITNWLSTYAVNAGTTAGAFARGVRFKIWVAMDDSHTRETHNAADGQVRPIGSTFTVGGARMAYPGDPSGPLDEVMNCRCVLMPASREGEAMSTNTYVLGPQDQLEENPDIELGYDVIHADASMEVHADVDDADDDDDDALTEIPVHGVLAPEGVETGDGRMFAVNALSHRALPLPIQYQRSSSEGHGGSSVVGRIDEVFREGNEMRFRGAVVLNREFANEVIDGIVDGTVRGVSVDIDNAVLAPPDESQIAQDEGDLFDVLFSPGVTVFSEARIAAVTIVAIPAFQEAYISLGHEFESELSPEGAAALAACGCGQAEPGLAGYEDTFREWDTAARQQAAENGQALPDGSFPIADEEDLRNAIQSIGRASNPAVARAHIKKRAAALGKSELIPEDWAGQGESFAGVLQDPAHSFAPGTHDGPGWITNPGATARIRRYWVSGKGAAKIRWGAGGDFNRCRKQLAKYVKNPDWLAGLCANMHKEALGIWPAQHDAHTNRGALIAAGGLAEPIFRLVAAGTTVYPAEFFQRPEFSRATPMTIDPESRRIYGHLAEWRTCHIGIQGICTEAPPSPSGYSYFLKGVLATTGGDIRVGTLTHAIGHAGERMSAARATAHYDRTDSVVAYVNMGEDEFGIWYSGVIPARVSDETIEELRAVGAFSGDWRSPDGYGPLDLVAAVSVPGPGFQIPRLAASGGHQISLVAAGIVAPSQDSVPAVQSFAVRLDEETIGAISRNAVAEYRHQEKVAAALGPVREKIRQDRLASARARLGGN